MVKIVKQKKKRQQDQYSNQRRRNSDAEETREGRDCATSERTRCNDDKGAAVKRTSTGVEAGGRSGRY